MAVRAVERSDEDSIRHRALLGRAHRLHVRHRRADGRDREQA